MSLSDRAQPRNEAPSANESISLTPHPCSRSLRDQGVTWSVYEDQSTTLGSSLIFESDKIARRVRDYPANWRELSDAELAALSWSR